MLPLNVEQTMLEAASLLIDGLHTFWKSLTSDPIRSVTAFAATGGLIVGWKNLNKDSIRVDVVVKRAQNGPLVLQHPTEEFLLFEIYNQGMCPVVVNEVGIKVSGRLFNQAKFINLVDLPDSYLDIRGKEEAIGTLECVGVPGTIPIRSLGVFLLRYSGMRNASLEYKKQKISPTNLNHVGSQKVIKTFQEFQSLEVSEGKSLQIIPYVLTGSGERFVGRKGIIKLGNLSEVV